MNRLRHKKRSGFTLIELLIVISIIGILVAILLPAGAAAMDATNRLACAANLSSIGKAIATYANKYNGHYPTVYVYNSTGTNAAIATGQAWADAKASPTYSAITNDNLDDWTNNPQNTLPSKLKAFTCNLSCLFLMVRTGDAANEGIFLCKADGMQTTDPDAQAGPQNFWSFSFITNCSYSFQNQIYDSATGINGGGRNTSQNTIDPNMIVAADMNPSRYFDQSANPPAEVNSTIAKQPGLWNSPNHKYKGQNCLYGDGHVFFNDNPFCGYGNSNIWTRGQGCAPAAVGNTAVAVWTNSDPNNPNTSSGSTGGGTVTAPQWDQPWGGTTYTGGTGIGTGDKYNSFLVP